MKLQMNGWGTAKVENIMKVLESIHCVFLPCFGESMNHQQLAVAHDDSGPVTYKAAGIILLSAKDLYWCQYAYQFAHEYCHFNINGKVPQQMRWFEESLCELASYYFLPLIAEQWSVKPPYQNWRSYAPFFISYVEERQKNATPFNLDFSSNKDILEHLIEDEYDREKNAYIAIKLTPIFQKNPTLWSVIHYIGDIPTGLTFAESLRCWHHLVPDDYRKGICEIAQTFSIAL